MGGSAFIEKSRLAGYEAGTAFQALCHYRIGLNDGQTEDTGTIGDKLEIGYVTIESTRDEILASVERYDTKFAAKYGRYRPQFVGERRTADPEVVAVLQAADPAKASEGKWTVDQAVAAASLLMWVEDDRCSNKYGECGHIPCVDGHHVFFGWSND